MSEPHRIGGRYEVGALLGRGGMAEVRKGTDARLGRTVAIKRLRTDLASDATFQARFRREAQSAASLNHPAIVSVYDTGEEMSTDGTEVPQPYIVMEYVAGRTLREILREGRKILPERALEITSGVLAALDYSHRAGIIHRDIKPGNVMLTPSGDVKVMDFGIARAVSDAQNTMTQTAAVVGTAQYLSPEQARGETVDSRSDVYSTGCLLYELLTGRPPFVGDSPVSVAYQHVREQAPPPSSLDEELTPEVDAIVMKALTKDVADRYASAAAMKADIDRYLAGKPVQAPAVAPPMATEFIPRTPAGPPTTVVPAVTEEEPSGRRWGPIALLALLLAAIIAAALIFGPKLFTSAPQKEAVPTIKGMTQAQAEQAITDSQLTVGTVTQQPSEDVEKGMVISQDPEPQTRVEIGSRVDFVVSSGKPEVELPDVVGDDKESAADLLRGRRLQVVLKQKESDQPANEVIEMQPPAGTKVASDSKVTLFWSTGPKQVPNVVGKSQAEATRLIEAAGFKVSVIPDPNAQDVPKGTVTRQSPDAGEPQNKGAQVTIVVGDYTPPVVTPTPPPITESETPGLTPPTP